MHQLSFLVTPQPDHSVVMSLMETAGIRGSARPVFRSLPALERALDRVGLPRSIATATRGSDLVPVTYVQLSRLGLL